MQQAVRLHKMRTMKLKMAGLAITIIITLLASCGRQLNQSSFEIMLKGLLNHSVPERSVAQVKEEQQCIFLDARERNEFDVSHIKNAVWVGYKNFSVKQLKGIDKNEKIIVYCSIGYRSEKVAEKLIEAGYTNVSNLYGGIFGWVNDGNLVYKNSNKPTSEVHAYNHLWSKWLRVGKKVYD